jgi:hypothetical protein
MSDHPDAVASLGEQLGLGRCPGTSWCEWEWHAARDETQKRRETWRHKKEHKWHKTKRGHGSGTLIANLQALLSIAKFLEIFHSLRSLLMDSS